MKYILPILLLAITTICPAQDPGAKDSQSWDKGLLVTISNGSVSKIPSDRLNNLPIGYPAFHKLKIEKERGKNQNWIVLGTIISTNTGLPRPDSVVYFRSGGEWKLAALPNSRGEIHFKISNAQADSGFLYVTSSPFQSDIPPDSTILREYRLEKHIKAQQGAAANP